MNLLLGQLPKTVEINGHEWLINHDFRACLQTILAFEDPDLTPEEKNVVLLNNLYPEIPPDQGKALKAALDFLNGGEETQEETEGPRLYSFAKDANYIYAAFRQTHGIDLSTVQMHWWVFLALFMDLGSETVFCNLISMRKRYRDGKLTKEERREYNQHPELYDLPEIDTRTLEEKIAHDNFMRLAKEGKYREQVT
jgi:hypothetical protein